MTDPDGAAEFAAATDWLIGGGEMGRVIREKDWSQTPLGPIEQWPQSLRTTVSICLASNFPISIAWGPERTQIYNDGYWPICGAKHPESMGQDFRECWEAPWPAIGGTFENATEGRTGFLENQRMFLDRHGYLEETFFTFSFSPIRDESGGVGGLFHPVTELTQQTLAERRLRVLRALADGSAEAKTVASCCQEVIGALAPHQLDVPFALLYLLDDEGGHARLAASTGLTPGTSACPEFVDLNVDSGVAAGDGWPIAEAAHRRDVVEVGGLESRFGSLSAGEYPESPHTALVLPVTISGLPHTFGVLVAGVSARRELDEPYRLFFLMLRESVTNALTNARAYEAERTRAEGLAELDRAKTEFFSNISHEFRTPLTLLLGPIEQLRADPELTADPRVADELEVAHRNGLRLSRLVNTVLDFSRLQAGRTSTRFEPVELGAVTAELASMFRSATDRAGIGLVLECPPLPRPVWVDVDSWEKVVLNLLSNAVKFTFTGSITVSVSATPDDGALLTVTDTGIGIPEAEQGRLFERFHQVSGARGRSVEGSGIGLALAHELVALHGGTFSVDSRLGSGSTFTVRVPGGYAHLPADRVSHSPVRDSGEAAGEGSAAAEPFVTEAMRWLPGQTRHGGQAGPGERRVRSGDREIPAAAAGYSGEPDGRVLVADDNTDMREYLQRLLSPRHHVTMVADGDAALASALADPPDLIVSDVMMPGRDGMALLAALRADPATESVPVLLLSARAGEDAAVEALAGGADDYLVKPFTAPELLARVDAHLRLNRARRETERVKQRYLAARDVVLALQGSLLPEFLPVLPGIRLAAHYLVAGSEQRAGGDWFDAVPLPDGRVALVAGDVVGHGARASAAMGQLRAVLTECLLEGHGVSDSLARLDRFVARVPSAAATTVCLAILDPESGRVAYACSGHPPPLLVTAGGRAAYLPARQGAPLGTAGGPPVEQIAWLKSGDMILIYTDGLVERPGRPLPAGLDELRAHAAQALIQGSGRAPNAAAVERVCRLSMERMTGDGYADDVSLIAAQRVSPIPSAFEARLGAAPEILAGLRRDLGAWLGGTGASDEDVWRVQLAVGEAVTNVIDHAYPGGAGEVGGEVGGEVIVEGYHDPDGRACFTISDRGRWRPPPAEPDARGRGLIMIRACMDTVEVERSPAGTTVLMDRLLGRKPVFASADDDGPRLVPTVPDRPLQVEVQRSARTRLTVTGSVDANTIDDFRRRLQAASRGGTLPLELDLTGVEVLASAGVQALHELAEQMAADDLSAHLIAPRGCPARYVLELTGLDHLLVAEAPVWAPPLETGSVDSTSV